MVIIKTNQPPLLVEMGLPKELRWKSPLGINGFTSVGSFVFSKGCYIQIATVTVASRIKLSNVMANNVDNEQTLRSMVSHLGLLCLPMSFISEARH